MKITKIKNVDGITYDNSTELSIEQAEFIRDKFWIKKFMSGTSISAMIEKKICNLYGKKMRGSLNCSERNVSIRLPYLVVVDTSHDYAPFVGGGSKKTSYYKLS